MLLVMGCWLMPAMHQRAPWCHVQPLTLRTLPYCMVGRYSPALYCCPLAGCTLFAALNLSWVIMFSCIVICIRLLSSATCRCTQSGRHLGPGPPYVFLCPPQLSKCLLSLTHAPGRIGRQPECIVALQPRLHPSCSCCSQGGSSLGSCPLNVFGHTNLTRLACPSNPQERLP
jgi:hypothetical protein